MTRKCSRCEINSDKITRGFCQNCYVWLRNNGQINNIPIIPLPDSLSKEQEEILIGSMLGDGNLGINKKGINARFTIKRKIEDKEYLLWEYEKFSTFCGSPTKEHYPLDKRTNKIYPAISFCTRASPIFTNYYKIWYPNKIKIVPKNLELTPLTLLIWFLDDGSINRSKTDTLDLKLSTNGFLMEDVQRLADMLTKRYKQYYGVNKNGNGFVIQTSDGGAKSFISEIMNLIPECMSRKIKWNGINLNIIERKSKKLNPSIDMKILYEALLSFSSNEAITTKTVVDKVLSEMNKDDRERAQDYIFYYLKKLSKQQHLEKIDPGYNKAKVFYITEQGREFFRNII